MSVALLVSYIFHIVPEAGAAIGLAFWIAGIWNQNPAPLLVRLVRNPLRFWIACGFAILPSLLGSAIVLIVVQSQNPGAAMRLMSPLFFFMSFVYGALFGVAGSCCAVSGNEGARFRTQAACFTAIALVLAPPWFFVLPQQVSMLVHIGSLIVILVVAKALIPARNEVATAVPPIVPHSGPPPIPHAASTSSPLLGLIIGFLPTLLVLVTISTGVSGLANGLSKSDSAALLWAGSGVSVICCFAASFLLFRRKTNAAIVGGVLLLLLNAFLALFFGCCASLSTADFR